MILFVRGQTICTTEPTSGANTLSVHWIFYINHCYDKYQCYVEESFFQTLSIQIKVIVAFQIIIHNWASDAVKTSSNHKHGLNHTITSIFIIDFRYLF